MVLGGWKPPPRERAAATKALGRPPARGGQCLAVRGIRGEGGEKMGMGKEVVDEVKEMKEKKTLIGCLCATGERVGEK